MAYFARQKRQSKFYWAELGFMALGLLGLQPSLFTNLILGSQTKSISYDEPYYQASHYQPLLGYRDRASGQFASLLPVQPVSSPFISAQGWVSQNSNSYLPSPSYNQSAYHQPSSYVQQQPYAQSSYAQSLYAQQPTSVGVTGFAPQQNYLPQSAYNQQPQQFSPSAYQAASNAWANQPAYLAQANTGYSTPSAAANNNWSGAQPNLYGNNNSNYQASTNYPSNLYPSNTNSKASSYPYNALAPRSAQQQTFGNNTSYYNSGPTNNASSAQSYPYQSNAATSGSWQRYQAPGSPLYR